MTLYVGGLRARFIRESVYQHVRSAITDIGWFDAGRVHLPITFLDEAVPNRDEVKINTAALSDETQDESEEEIGSNLSEHRWLFYIDFYGESDALSTHFIHDVRDILRGRFTHLGQTGPHISVYDYSMATPGYLFDVQIENVLVDRAHNVPTPRLAHWYSVRFEVVDHYADQDY